MKPPRRPGRPAFMPTGRTLTIKRLVERLQREAGREPTDAELASLLAIGVATVRRHRHRTVRRGAA